ncbi:TPA: toxin-activating lysine-acyltransferase, partial [Escherichia coli]|nr:toxin-activating lysine-acyltransferase [Escherichia coli]
KNNFNVFGKVTWLWSYSPLHRDWPISMQSINIIPAIMHGQYVILMEKGFPVAYCSWAKLDLDNEVKYIKNTNALTIDDWNSGDRNWFIDWVAPFGHSNQLYKIMRKKFPDGLFRSIRVTKNSTTGKIYEFHGGKVNKLIAKKQFLKYHHDLIQALKNLEGLK